MPENTITEEKDKKPKEKKEKDSINLIYMIRKIYPICFKSNPQYFVFNQILGMLQGLSYGVIVMVTQVFFDTIYNASTGKSNFNSVVIMFIVYVMFTFANDILHATHNFTGSVQHARILGYMNAEIIKKSALFDPIEYENPKRLDDINKASNGTSAAIHFQYITSSVFSNYLPYFIFMGFYLTSLKPMLILCLLFVFVPVVTAQILRSAVFSKLEDKSAPIRREFDAYNDAACGKGFFKETRNLGSFKYLKSLIENSIHSLNSAIWGANKRSALINFGFNTLSLMGYGGILFLLVKYLLDGEISVGAFAAIYNSIGTLYSIMNYMITEDIGNFANNFGQIRNFLRFLEIPTDKRPEIIISKKDSITVENVSFTYPNAEKQSLKNINLVIKPRETIAIVGENGAGKTTLVKLLTGMYKPTEGTVKIGETDVNSISYRSLFESVSGVFQKYQRYALTLKENIQISEFTDETDGKVERILIENNIDKDNLHNFPNGLNTILSREFDGTDLSGGQWQRIAIARGFYRNSDIIVLDEPTASIDPIEESAIYKKFVEVANEKTAIIVTHRMGSAKIAKRIVVMKEGKIVETGSHDELVNSGGVYAQMYSAQAGWYN